MATGLAPVAAAQDEDGDALELAFRYGFPVYEMARLRYALQFDPAAPRRLPSNYLYHNRALATPASRVVTTPNADTLYSLALLDLRAGPVRIDVPDMGDRYYSIALIDAYTNDFAYIGRRTTGTRAGSYLLVAPSAGRSTSPVLPTIEAPTPLVVLLARILVRDSNDVQTVHRLQGGIRLTAPRAPMGPAPVAPIPGSGTNFVAVVNGMLADNPPPAADKPVLDRIANVGIGPAAAPPNPALRQMWSERFTGIRDAFVAGAATRRQAIDGWSYPPPNVGRFGTDYLARAEVALSSFLANVREEDTALVALTERSGAPLESQHAYRLRLPSPMPVDAFWSLSMYEAQPDGRLYFTDNPLHRYTIGDRSPGLRRSPDGSVEIRIASDRPAGVWEGNWLPAPSAPWRLILRNYQPRPELLDGRFRYPALERA